ncbi:capsular polysaccharide biosynthesis protein [Halomonas lysinitropha]|uniref:Capsule polysaccharide biosynthesis protein n=1 Tax=Halomonas lysinitropha TaxID=2607506 RepID=A0A5K1I2U1_9GAMM|nr:capsular polysaccharide biosynthesis protein [Halomonas lysinitropha]VVZ95765.1 Capsule polysaccharide biosynthesis protein [Halomonas lysinitropha]
MESASRKGLPFAACASRGIRRLSLLPACLTEYQGFGPLTLWRRPDVILGWGLKPTSQKARRMAEQRGIPYVALEDGFLRSWGLGVNGYQPHSLIVDTTGIYYDATRPSDLEQLILEAPFGEAELQRAERCMTLIRHHRLSKYNHAPDRSLPASQRRRVLVVDQTAGDASIHYGGADADRFHTMLQGALDEHPEAEILVKVHPDVVAGSKRGHLLQAAEQHPRCRLIAEDLNPWCLFDAVDTVHVVTSQLGFEALLAGCRVVCHGLPFYAGWGLTDDRLSCARREPSRSLVQLFTAAYLRYCRYANPYTGEAASLEETIELIADQKRQQERLAGRWHAGGFSRWKRGFIGDFLGPGARLRHHASAQAAARAAVPGERVFEWSNRIDTTLEERCRERGLALWRMEDGFIRSVGLGVDLARPLSLVLDSQGIYYDPQHPSDLEHLLNEAEFDTPLLHRAARLRQRLVELRLSKYNLAGQPLPDLPTDKPWILVPGQVESDASIARGSPVIRTNAELLAAVRDRHPDAYVIYKPHPDVLSGARVGALDTTAKQLYDRELGEIPIAELLEVVDEIHTMSSLTGFEALLRGKPVTTYGLPFYAGWGLTDDHQRCPRRRRRLSLDALVAGTLLLYPTYVDPYSRQLCNAETVVSLLERQRARNAWLPWKTRLYRRYRNAFAGRH